MSRFVENSVISTLYTYPTLCTRCPSTIKLFRIQVNLQEEGSNRNHHTAKEAGATKRGSCSALEGNNGSRAAGGGARGVRGRDHGEVGACQTGGVAAVDDDRQVTEVVRRAWSGGEVEIGVAGNGG